MTLRPSAPHTRFPWSFALILTLVCPLLWIACWPFAPVGVNDDFSYAFTVKRLVETGRFTYNAWSSAMLGAQALWAVPFVKAFGFSHDILRVTTIPWAIGCAWLTYALHRRFEVARTWSLFSALLVTTSPLFTPWSASFMTDVPGLFLTLTLFHVMISLRHAGSMRGITCWACALAVVGVLGGTVRQTLFVFAGVALLMEIVSRRRERPATYAVAGIGVVYLAAAFALIRWNAAQPYYLPELRPGLRMLPRAVPAMLRLGLDGVLCALPLAAALAGRSAIPRGRPGAMLVSAAALLTAALLTLPATSLSSVLAPWTGNTLTPTGFLSDDIDAPGTRPIVLFGWVRAIATLATLAAIYGAVPHARRVFATAHAAGWRRLLVLDAQDGSLAAILAMGLTYLVLLVPRACFGGLVFDRYLLVLLPIASLMIFATAGRHLPGRPSLAGWIALTLYAAFGVAITSDHFAELRARGALADRLIAEGVPRETIANGLVFDSWTQLERRGYLNDNRLKNPPGAYQPDPDATARAAIFWFLPLTPAIRPAWVIENAPSVVVADDHAIGFRTLLSPNRRWIFARPIASPAARVTSE